MDTQPKFAAVLALNLLAGVEISRGEKEQKEECIPPIVHVEC